MYPEQARCLSTTSLFNVSSRRDPVLLTLLIFVPDENDTGNDIDDGYDGGDGGDNNVADEDNAAAEADNIAIPETGLADVLEAVSINVAKEVDIWLDEIVENHTETEQAHGLAMAEIEATGERVRGQ